MRRLLSAACATLAAASAVAMGAAGTGTGGGPASTPAGAASTPAEVQAAYRQQCARCMALTVAAVRAECLRQAERDLAQGLAALQKPRP
ncbi:MAG: hypothetical protein V4795_08380 [Pseudomonadota bacterium]